uniref:(California timema) hypothetical protein n=1 Tax=Timema californicum TaxID=61474 RepID=A0A7R9PCY2_TIMCA|nr:unnamed protein product [Timema californicum]
MPNCLRSVRNSGTSELDHMAHRVFILVFSSNLNDEQCSVLKCVEDPYKALVSRWKRISSENLASETCGQLSQKQYNKH